MINKRPSLIHLMVVMRADGRTIPGIHEACHEERMMSLCHDAHCDHPPQSPLFIRNVSRLHTTIYTTFQTYNYHLQINLTLAPRFLINYLMRRINGHREISPKLHWDPGAWHRLQRPIKSGLNARRDSALHWVNVSLFHRRRFLSGGRCLTWYFESLPSFEAQTTDSRDTERRQRL